MRDGCTGYRHLTTSKKQYFMHNSCVCELRYAEFLFSVMCISVTVNAESATGQVATTADIVTRSSFRTGGRRRQLGPPIVPAVPLPRDRECYRLRLLRALGVRRWLVVWSPFDSSLEPGPTTKPCPSPGWRIAVSQPTTHFLDGWTSEAATGTVAPSASHGRC